MQIGFTNITIHLCTVMLSLYKFVFGTCNFECCFFIRTYFCKKSVFKLAFHLVNIKLLYCKIY